VVGIGALWVVGTAEEIQGIYPFRGLERHSYCTEYCTSRPGENRASVYGDKTHHPSCPLLVTTNKKRWRRARDRYLGTEYDLATEQT